MARHQPAVEVKGATWTGLRVAREGGSWVAECVVDVERRTTVDLSLLKRRSEFEWWIEPRGKMRVPGVLFASEPLVRAMDHKVFEQVTNVATLPGSRAASMAMPDAHWGYGFPSGASPPSTPRRGRRLRGRCGLRHLLRRALPAHAAHPEEVEPRKKDLADGLFATIPAGVGSRGRHPPLRRGDGPHAAGRGAVGGREGLGRAEATSSDRGGRRDEGRRPEAVSDRAKRGKRDEMGTLGSGNHYLEVQEVAEIHDAAAA